MGDGFEEKFGHSGIGTKGDRFEGIQGERELGKKIVSFSVPWSSRS